MQHSRCWLCECSESPEAKLFHSFAVQNAPRVDARSMASAFYQVLCERTTLDGEPSDDHEQCGGRARGYRRKGAGRELGSGKGGKHVARERDEDCIDGRDTRSLEDEGLDGDSASCKSLDGDSASCKSLDGDSASCKSLDGESEESGSVDGRSQDEEDKEIPSVDEIYAHLSLHVLHPTVRVAHALRGLVELSETLKELMVTKGGESENPLVDVCTVTMYLKVTVEIMQVYRSADPSKMLFGGEVK